MTDPSTGLQVLGMPTATPNSNAYNALMATLTGNPQYSMGAPQANQALSNMTGSLSQSGQGSPQFQPAHWMQQLRMAHIPTQAPSLASLVPWLKGG
ncbi:MAG TPA: hypothetical protein VN660_02060 [Steroidobacteraceae bacterium]|nr:hypothetical protein [Steroidobacteraceae bacterium]